MGIIMLSNPLKTPRRKFSRLLQLVVAWYKSTDDIGPVESVSSGESMTCPFCGLTATRDTSPSNVETYSCPRHTWGAQVQALAGRLEVVVREAGEREKLVVELRVKLSVAQDELAELNREKLANAVKVLAAAEAE